jgi:hypothetical protein
MKTREIKDGPSLDDIVLELKYRNLNPVEKAKAYEFMLTLVKRKYPDSKKVHPIRYLARMLSLPAETINHSLQLLKFDPALQQLIIDGVLPESSLTTLIRIQNKYGKKLDGKVLAKFMVQGRMSPDDIRAALKQALEETGVFKRDINTCGLFQVAKKHEKEFSGIAGEPIVIMDPMDPDYEEAKKHLGIDNKKDNKDKEDVEVPILLITRRTNIQVSKIKKKALIKYQK